MSESINKKNYDKYEMAGKEQFPAGRTETAGYPRGQVAYAHRGLKPLVVDLSKMTEDDKAAYAKNLSDPNNAENYA